MNKSSGFTFLEMIITIGMIVILTVIAIIFLNPGQQFAKSRNTRRASDIYVLGNAIGQNAADNRGIFSCSAGTAPASSTKMAVGVGNYNIGPCLVKTYLQALPFDPSATTSHWTSITDYDTGYTISRSTTTGRITIAAPLAEVGQSISITR